MCEAGRIRTQNKAWRQDRDRNQTLTTHWGCWGGHTEATKKNGTGRGTKLNDLRTRNMSNQTNTQK